MPNSSQELSYTVGFDDLDLSLLPEDARVPGTDRFRQAVTQWFTDQYRHLGGRAQIIVNERDRRVDVRWTRDRAFASPEDIVLDLLNRGDYQKAGPLLETLILQDSTNPTHFYNLGMVLSDQGKIERAKRMLQTTLKLAPHHVNAQVALGVAHSRAGNLDAAIAAFKSAIVADPENGWAHRNLGACLMKIGNPSEAIPFLERSVELLPDDQPSLYGLAQCLESLDRSDDADELYLQIIRINEHSPLAEAARTARSKIAHGTFRQRGGENERPDAVMYLLGAIERFDAMPLAEVQQIGCEIALVGMKGLDTNDPQQKYTLKSLPGKFSGLHLVCLMHVAFKKFAPDADIGFDLSREYAIAESMKKRPS